MKYSGKLTISRVYGGKNYIEIKLVDEKSHQIVSIVKVSPETFGEVITGLSSQDVEYEFINNPSKFGKKIETKTEQIPIDYNGYDENVAKDKLKSIIKDYEIDGWESDINGSFGRQTTYGKDNDNNRCINVWFRRWV